MLTVHISYTAHKKDDMNITLQELDESIFAKLYAVNGPKPVFNQLHLFWTGIQLPQQVTYISMIK